MTIISLMQNGTYRVTTEITKIWLKEPENAIWIEGPQTKGLLGAIKFEVVP